MEDRWRRWPNEPPYKGKYEAIELVFADSAPALDAEGEVLSVHAALMAERDMTRAWWRPLG